MNDTRELTDMGLLESVLAGGLFGGRYSRLPVEQSIESILRNVRGARRLALARQRVEVWLGSKDPSDHLTISELAVVVQLFDEPAASAAYAAIDLELSAGGSIRQIGIATTAAGTRLLAEGTVEDMAMFSSVASKRTLVAHNGAAHDFPLLRSAGLNITRCTDSLQWAWIAWPLLHSHSLGALVESEAIDIDVFALHDAVNDAEALAMVWERVRSEISGLDAATRTTLRDCLGSVEPQDVVTDLLGSDPDEEWHPRADPWMVGETATRRTAVVLHTEMADHPDTWPVGSVIATDDSVNLRRLAGGCGLHARPSEILDSVRLLTDAQGWERAVGLRVLDVANGYLALAPPSARRMLAPYRRRGSGTLVTSGDRHVSTRFAVGAEIPNLPVIIVDGLASLFAPLPTGVSIRWPGVEDSAESAISIDELGAEDRQLVIESLVLEVDDDPALAERAHRGEGTLVLQRETGEWQLPPIDPHDYPFGITIALRGPTGSRRSSALWKNLLGSDVEVQGPAYLGTSWTAVEGLDGATRSRTSGMAATRLLSVAASSLRNGQSSIVIAASAAIDAISESVPGLWRGHTGQHLLRPPRWPTVDESARRLKSGGVAIAGFATSRRLAANATQVLVTRTPLPPLVNHTVRNILERASATSSDPYGEIIEPLGAHLVAELVSGTPCAEVLIADPLRGTGYLSDLIGQPRQVHIDELPVDAELRDQISMRLMKRSTRREVRSQLLASSVRRMVGEGQLRDFQRAIIDDCLAERDVVAVFRTGLGKSLCYQVPALMLGASGAVTVVISPLIALQQDQLAGLRRRGVFEATIYNSQMSAEVRRSVRRGLEAGFYTMVFLAPEALHGRAIAQVLARLDLGILVVDEAHCISEMGHDFRPDYRTLPVVIRRLLKLADDAPFPASGHRPTIMALTGTASPQVIDDIRERLS